MAQRDSMRADGAARFALEAHYYSGGLHIRPIGADQPSPPWVPSPADRYVGFRNEFSLIAGDAVVEVARYDYHGNSVTWVAVYRKSVDEVFGDRGNHAGVGVWLNGALITDAYLLLEGLNALAEGLVSGSPEAIEADAAAFAGAKYLPKYLDLAAHLPDGLSGWRYSPTNICHTEMFYAGATTQKESWGLAAEQIYRVSLLPAPSPTQCRAIILVPAPETFATGRSFSKMLPLNRTSLAEVTRFFPGAIHELSLQNEGLSSKSESLEGQLNSVKREAEELAGELQNQRHANSALTEQVTHLNDQLTGDNTAKWLSSIDSRLIRFDSALRENSNSISDLSRIIRTNVPRARVDTPSAPVGNDARRMIIPDTQVHDSNFDRLFGWKSIVGLIIFIALIIALVFVIWNRGNHPEVPPLDTGISTTAS